MERFPQVAIITGAGGTGSGRAIARRFANDGAAVVVADINDAGGRLATDDSLNGRIVVWWSDSAIRNEK
jgi:NAD(P)-dependent dehydrogenase (short-subunit alcohol dehydrogenase family)